MGPVWSHKAEGPALRLQALLLPSWNTNASIFPFVFCEWSVMGEWNMPWGLGFSALGESCLMPPHLGWVPSHPFLRLCVPQAPLGLHLPNPTQWPLLPLWSLVPWALRSLFLLAPSSKHWHPASSGGLGRGMGGVGTQRSVGEPVSAPG